MPANKSASYYQRNRERILSRAKARYRDDEIFRNGAKKKSRERYSQDPKYRKATIRRAKRRYRRLLESK